MAPGYVFPAIGQPHRGQALAFKHLDVEVTAVKVAFFREALIEAAALSFWWMFWNQKREGCPDII